jgi:hypothetical protein
MRKQPPSPEATVAVLRCTACNGFVSGATAQAAHAAMLEHQRFKAARRAGVAIVNGDTAIGDMVNMEKLLK